jgi:foldase protein PrsA
MRRIIAILFGIVVVLAVSACGGGGSRSVPSNAVAVVGDQSISKASWDELIAQTKANYQANKHPFPKPGTVDLANLRSNATQFLISASEYDQEAAKMHITISNADIEARLNQVKQQFGAQPGQPKVSKATIEKRYQAALKAQGFTDAQVREGIKLTLIHERVQAAVTKNITVSDSDIQKYYDKNKAQYSTPAQPESRPVKHILVKTKALADRIYAQLQANPSLFGKLAKKYSTDTVSAKAGGVLAGGDVKGRFVKSFEDVAFKLKTNEISKPVHSRFGWHIIEATGPIKPPTKAKPTPLSQVKEAIRQTLLQNKKTQAAQEWQKKMVKSYCKTIGYQTGYAPPPGQDPCKQSSSTTSATT